MRCRPGTLSDGNQGVVEVWIGREEILRRQTEDDRRERPPAAISLEVEFGLARARLVTTAEHVIVCEQKPRRDEKPRPVPDEASRPLYQDAAHRAGHLHPRFQEGDAHEVIGAQHALQARTARWINPGSRSWDGRGSERLVRPRRRTRSQSLQATPDTGR